MSNIEERLDEVRTLIQTPDFLGSRGLSNEVNIRIFCYAPEDEMAVSNFVQRLSIDQTLKCNLKVKNLYKIFIEACKDMEILEEIPEMEEEDGSEFLLDQLRFAVGDDEFIRKICYTPHKSGDVLMLTGVGEVFPFTRVHSILDALQPYFTDMPIVVMYPGKFDGHQLKLFNRLKPNDYYRAFSIV